MFAGAHHVENAVLVEYCAKVVVLSVQYIGFTVM
jgi:hypothetical protein